METIEPNNIFKTLNFYLADWDTPNEAFSKIDWNSHLTLDLQVDKMFSNFLKLVSDILCKTHSY